MQRLKDRWRPSLGLVVGAILLLVLALPLAGLFFFRLYENQLVRETEAELIAQGAVAGAVYLDALRETGAGRIELGAPMPPDRPDPTLGRYRPLEPRLDLAVDPILPPRPESAPGVPDPTLLQTGLRLSHILAAAQTVTLAGFRLLDAKGIVVAGGGETGRSLAGIEEVRTALAGHYASVLRRRVSDEPAPPLYSISRGTGLRVFVAMPLALEGRVAGVVYLSRTPGNIVRHLYGERGKVIGAAFTVIGATLLIGFVFWRAVSRPIHELQRRTARIAAGDKSALAPLRHHGTREMAELAGAFLDMAGRLQARTEAIRTFATHLSHEMKSPLSSVGGAAELLRDSGSEMTEEQRTRFLDNIVSDIARLSGLLRRLLELARAENAGQTGEASSLEESLAGLPVPPALPVQVEAGKTISLAISAENLGIILSNLLDNAAHHAATHFRLRADIEAGQAVIRACDDGEGVSPGNRTRIFEPFFTTRRESGGTGLGLGIVSALLGAHGGTIGLDGAEPGKLGRGACFRITLPLAAR